jgi:hypothetical protein
MFAKEIKKKMTLTENQEKWLQILETTDEPQTRIALFDGYGYCCLGICARFVLGIEPIYVEDRYEFKGETAVLGHSMGAEMGLMFNGGLAAHTDTLFYDYIKEAGYGGDKHLTLAGYNDAGATFKQIAYAIRKLPEAVFYEHTN